MSCKLPSIMIAMVVVMPARAVHGQEAKMLWNQSESTAIYTGVGIVKHYPASAFGFALSTTLNPPEFVEVYNESSLVYTFTNGAATYILDTARHNEGADNGAADVFTAELGGSGPTTLYGLNSAGSSTPVWSLPLPGCEADQGVGGTYVGLEASDSGDRLAFQCLYTDPTTKKLSARVYLVGAQSGKATWSYDVTAIDGAKAGQGQVQITGNGSYILFVNEQGVPTANSAEAYIIGGGASGAVLRGNISIPFFIAAAISDSADYVAIGDESNLYLYQWTGVKYTLVRTLTPPAGKGWIVWDLQMSTGPDGTDYVIAGCISDDVLTVQVTVWALTTGKQVTNWVSVTNAKLQENPTIRADGPYVGVSLWGDSGDVPTVVLLAAGSNTPLFTYVTPGSMFNVDILLDTSTPTQDTVILAASGKATPANAFGNGGDAYAWSIVVPK